MLFVAVGAAAAVDDTGYIRGLELSNDTDADHDIAIAAGKARNATDDATISLSSILTKQIDATWAAGDDAGGINDAETVGNSTWYHVHLLDGGSSPDAGFDTSITATNLLADTAVQAAGHTKYRRIGAVLTDGAANIRAFVQNGDHVQWVVPVQNLSSVNPGVAAVLQTMSCPLGLQTRVLVSATLRDSSPATSTVGLISSPSQADTNPASVYNMRVDVADGADSTYADVLTNTSSQIRFRLSNSDTGVVIILHTFGYIDPRGKY